MSIFSLFFSIRVSEKNEKISGAKKKEFSQIPFSYFSLIHGIFFFLIFWKVICLPILEIINMIKEILRDKMCKQIQIFWNFMLRRD